MRIKQFLIAVCIGTMFAACSNEEVTEQKLERIPIKFTAHIQNLIPSVGTRVAQGTSGMLTTNFPANSEIQVGYYGNYEYSNDALITNATGSWGFKDNVLYLPLDENEVVLGAVYPPLSNNSIGNFLIGHNTYMTPDDQSSITDYNKADIIGAVAKVSSLTTGPVNLSFEHLSTKIIVKLVGIGDLSGYTIKMTNINKSGLIQGGSSGFTHSHLPYNVGSTILGNYSSSGQSAIIVPQTISSNTDLFEVSNGDKTYIYTQTSDITFKKGYVYTFNLKFDGTAITVGTISMSGWGSDEDYSTPIDGTLSEQTT